MKNDLFEKAKQAVAESRGAESWIVMYAAYTGLASQIGEDAAFDMLDSACREVAERMANEAVKADRKCIYDWLNRPPMDFSRDTVNYALKTLPFPQQPDGR